MVIFVHIVGAMVATCIYSVDNPGIGVLFVYSVSIAS